MRSGRPSPLTSLATTEVTGCPVVLGPRSIVAAEANVPVSVEIYDGMPHVFQADAELQPAKMSFQRLGHFIRQRAGRAAATAAQ